MNMKPQFMLPCIVLFLGTLALAQHEMETSATQPPSDAQKSFTQLKSLAGTWRGSITVDPPQPQIKNGELGQITLRVTSRGNALVHEMNDPTKPDDPTKYDHPVTMFYLDNDRLTLVHYCDAGNRPRMVARTSPDGKTVEFDFLDISGNTNYGHMQHAVFTVVDANHHIEDWTFLMPGDKPVHARMDLTRAQ
jgi:phage tail protein X